MSKGVDPAWLALGAQRAAEQDAVPGDDAWEKVLAAGRQEPGEFFKQRNVVTQALARDLSQDTLIPVDSPGGKNQHSVAAQLLRTFDGDFDLIQEALNHLRRKQDLRGASVYYLKKIIENEGSMLQASKRRNRAEMDDLVAPRPEPEMVECPRCKKPTLHPDLPCAAH